MTTPPIKRLNRHAYNVGWICPLEVELSAARFLLDEEHDQVELAPGDGNQYVLGQIKGRHEVFNVVIASLPAGYQGVVAAGALASQLNRSFPMIQLRLLVGIGGGVPSKKDIRLGDVVVAEPTGTHGGLVQYDLGKDTIVGFQRKGFLEPPPRDWLSAMTTMKSDHRNRGSLIPSHLQQMRKNHPRLRGYGRPSEDVLFKADYRHLDLESTCAECGCDSAQAVTRSAREFADEPVVHYGLIASGNRVEKNAEERDSISKSVGGAICFEMEAAGLLTDMSGFRCIVIRGISDYADSHKNDAWHEYAAAAAAALAKELLGYMRLVTPSDAAGQAGLEANQRHFNDMQQNSSSEQNERGAAKVDRASLDLHVLKLTDPEDDLQRLQFKKGLVTHGTCAWLLESSQYQCWHRERSFLLITGSPGTGKTMMSAFLIDRLRSNLSAEGQNMRPIYFFCSSQEPDRATALAILRGLLYQLCQMEALKAYLDLEYDRHGEPKLDMLNNFDALWRVLTAVLQHTSAFNSILIIDALDECDESSQRQLIGYIKLLYARFPALKPKFIITSRNQRLLCSLDQSMICSIQLGQDDTRRDLAVYVASTVQALLALKPQFHVLSTEIRHKLENNAGSTFLWVDLAIEQLRQTETAIEAQSRLRGMPYGLPELYDNILSRVKEDAVEDNRWLFHVIVAAQRRMTRIEILEAYCLRSDGWDDFADAGPPAMQAHIFERSNSLITYEGQGDDQVVDLIHTSVKDYLTKRQDHDDDDDDNAATQTRATRKVPRRTARTPTATSQSAPKTVHSSLSSTTGKSSKRKRKRERERSRDDESTGKSSKRKRNKDGEAKGMPLTMQRRYHIDLSVAHYHLFQITFRALGRTLDASTLTIPEYSEGHIRGGNSGEAPQYNAIAVYARFHMHEHASAAHAIVQQNFPWLGELLYRKKLRCSLWLMLMAKSGNTYFMKELLDAGAALDGCYTGDGGFGRSPLALAAAYSNVLAMKEFIIRGASVEAKDTGSPARTALDWAFAARCVEAVQLLVDKGVHVARTLESIIKTHSFASSTFNWSNISVGDNWKQFNGNSYHVQIVWPELSRWPMRANTGSDRRQELLHALLSGTPDVDFPGTIHTAAENHDWAVLTQLLMIAPRAVVNIVAGDALLRALEIPRRIDTFRHLEASGNSQGFYGAMIFAGPEFTARISAAADNQSSEDCIRAILHLINFVEDVDESVGAGGRTALSFAVENGEPTIVKALLNKGARADHVDDAGVSALMWASQRPRYWEFRFKHVSITDSASAFMGAVLVLSDEIDSDVFEKCIQVVSDDDRITILSELLNAGAELDHRNAKGATAALIAADDGLHAVHDYLVSRAADATRSRPRGHPFTATNMFLTNNARLHFNPMSLGDGYQFERLIDPEDQDTCYINHDYLDRQANSKAHLGYALTGPLDYDHIARIKKLESNCTPCIFDHVTMADSSRTQIGAGIMSDIGTFDARGFDSRQSPTSLFRHISLHDHAKWRCSIGCPVSWRSPSRPTLGHFYTLPKCTFEHVSVEDQAYLETCNSLVIVGEKDIFALDTQMPGNFYRHISVADGAQWSSSIFDVQDLRDWRIGLSRTMKISLLEFLGDHEWLSGPLSVLANEISDERGQDISPFDNYSQEWLLVSAFGLSLLSSMRDSSVSFISDGIKVWAI